MKIQAGDADIPGRNARLDAALRFAVGLVEIRNRVSAREQKELDGRLRDGLIGDTAYPGLYIEVDTALTLMTKGYEVTSVDLGQSSGLDFSIGDNVAEVKWKSLTMDSGR